MNIYILVATITTITVGSAPPLTSHPRSTNLENGTHKFSVAPTGAADSTITWTDGLTIDNAGAVSIPSAAGTQIALTVKGGNNLVDNIALNVTNQAGDTGTNIRNNGQLLYIVPRDLLERDCVSVGDNWQRNRHGIYGSIRARLGRSRQLLRMPELEAMWQA